MRNSIPILSLLVMLLGVGAKSAAGRQSQAADTGPVQTNGAPPMSEKGYVLGTNGAFGTLYLTFPAGWRDRIEHVTEKDRGFDAVYFTPPAGESDFDFMVEIVMAGEKNNTNHEQLKTVLLQQGRVQQTNLVEKTIELKDLKGNQTVGSYFRVTDKKWAVVSPPEGETKYLTQGYASVGPLILTFHLYWNHPAAQEAAALEVIKTARYTKTPPPGAPQR